MTKRVHVEGEPRRRPSMAYTTSEMLSIMQYVERETGDANLVQSVHFSSTAMTLARRVMMNGGVIIADTTLVQSGINQELARKLGVRVECYINDPQVEMMAEQRRVTRAEVAVDHGLSMPGLKMMVVGSAPMALDRLLRRHQQGTLNDVMTVAAATGFASVVQLKEKIWESDLASIVVRGRKGGTAAAIAICNAILEEADRQWLK